MAKSKLGTIAKVDDERRTYLAGKAFGFRLDGMPVDEIAMQLEVSVEEVRALVHVAYGRLSMQSAEEARYEVEARLDVLLRRATVDLQLAESNADRAAMYRVLLAIERQRSELLGLNIPKGTPDA